MSVIDDLAIGWWVVGDHDTEQMLDRFESLSEAYEYMDGLAAAEGRDHFCWHWEWNDDEHTEEA